MNEATIPEAVPLARPVSVDGDTGIGPLPCAYELTSAWPAPMSRLRAVIELVVLLVCGLTGAFATYELSTRVPVPDPRWYQVLSSVGVGITSILACTLIVYVAGHKPVSIGWTRKDCAANAGIGIGALVATYVILFSAALAASFLFPSLLTETPEAQRAIEENFPPMRVYWVVPLTIFVALWEEIVFRGFVLTRLNAIFRRWWLTILLASSVFGAVHIYYEGLLAVLVISGLALVMSVLFVWRRSLVPSIVFHWLHNLVIFVLLGSISQTWQ